VEASGTGYTGRESEAAPEPPEGAAGGSAGGSTSGESIGVSVGAVFTESSTGVSVGVSAGSGSTGTVSSAGGVSSAHRLMIRRTADSAVLFTVGKEVFKIVYDPIHIPKAEPNKHAENGHVEKETYRFNVREAF